jgi:transcriptional regulator with XRE-family HTH domain
LEKIQKILAKNIKEIRARRGLRTQDALAEASGLAKNSIGQIETGIFWPSPKTLGQIANALGVEVSDLFQTDTSKYSLKPHDVVLFLKQTLSDEKSAKLVFETFEMALSAVDRAKREATQQDEE